MKEEYNSRSKKGEVAAKGSVATVVSGETHRKRAEARPEPVVGFRKTKSEDSLKGVKVVSPFNLSPNF